MVQPPFISSVTYNGFSVDILRLDQVHPEISGNKWYKLRYNLERIVSPESTVLLTFGGVHSNHIAATAVAANLLGVASAVIVRGQEEDSPTLMAAAKNGMKIFRLSRSAYKQKAIDEIRVLLKTTFANILEIPEGGSNGYGLVGCTEIPVPSGYDRICVACGTGTTFGGLVRQRAAKQITGFSVLKGENHLWRDLQPLFSELAWEMPSVGDTLNDAFAIVNTYAGKGYASFEKEVVSFASDFQKQTAIELDAIYTAKLFYGVFDLLKKGVFSKDEKMILLHTGGLQGNSAFYQRYAMQMSHLQ